MTWTSWHAHGEPTFYFTRPNRQHNDKCSLVPSEPLRLRAGYEVQKITTVACRTFNYSTVLDIVEVLVDSARVRELYDAL
jgi:hypothetical protein